MGGDPPDDYYELLGIEPDCDRAKLRRVWRRLALKWHPDRAGPDATALFQKMSAAYEVLSDPVARADYDQRRGAALNGSAGRVASPPPQPAPRPAPPDMLWRVSGSLKALLASGIARRADAELIDLFLTAREAAVGGMVTISLRVPVRCLLCGGRAGSPCVRCGGRGAVYQLFSAWLAVRPEVADGTILVPPQLGGMLRPVRFRIRVAAAP